MEFTRDEHGNEYIVSERLRLMLRLALRTGMRKGEILALRHDDRFHDGINVRASLTRKDGGLYVKETKGRKNRFIPLSDDLEPLIGHGRNGYVIHAEESAETPMWPRNAERLLDSALRHTKYKGVNFHDFRRTFATMLLRAGVDLKTASDILGHDPKMLLEIYAQSSTQIKREAIQKVFGKGA